MSVKLLTEHHFEFLAKKEAAEARPSLHMSNCHIAENLMHWLKSEWCPTFQTPLGGHARKDIQDTGFQLTPCIALTKTGVLLMKQLQAQMIAKEPVRSTPQSALL